MRSSRIFAGRFTEISFGLKKGVRVEAVIDAVEANGDLDNTLIIYTTDHGDMLGHHGLYLKGPTPYEDLMRVTMVARGPGVAANRVVKEPVSTLDLAATFYDAAGVSAPHELQGRSLKPLLEGKDAPRDAAWMEWHVHPSRCGVGLQLRTQVVAHPQHRRVQILDHAHRNAPRRQFADFLRTHALQPQRRGAVALDLGAGSGFQSLPLAEVGYAVTAIDLSETLLAELNRDAAAAHLTVNTVFGDMCDITWHTAQRAPELIVCASDTLTHLASVETVSALIRDAAARLADHGRLVLGFRDLATHELKGAQRFIPVRSEPDRIFTCFLDYRPDHVEVTDLVHTRDDVQWRLATSAYRKLRLTAAQVGTLITDAGLTLEHASTEQGAVRLVGVKRSPPASS